MRYKQKEIEAELSTVNRQLGNVIVFNTHYENEGHVIECYTKAGTFTLGYNLKAGQALDLLRSFACFFSALHSTGEANGIFSTWMLNVGKTYARH